MFIEFVIMNTFSVALISSDVFIINDWVHIRAGLRIDRICSLMN